MGQRLRQGAAGVFYGNPAHLLDAARYVKVAWDAVLPSSIRNSFVKAEIMSLDPAPDINDDVGVEIARVFEELHISIGSAELEEFVHIDDENNEEYVAVMKEAVEEMMDDHDIDDNVGDDDDDDEDDEDDNNQLNNCYTVSGSGVVFNGFAPLYKQVLDIEEQLLCSEVQDGADEKFDDLMNSFESFASNIQAISLQVKCKNQQVSSDS